ncbi:MAG: DNA methyltransferase [Methanoregula sp.]|jgi:DNA modification methylase
MIMPIAQNKIIVSSKLNSDDWEGSFSSTECTLHQISPYLGKIKSAFAKKLITTYSKPFDTILDPFAGSGTVALEALIAKRHVIANDINPYAVTLTNAKLNPPSSLTKATKKVQEYIIESKIHSKKIDLEEVPLWVKKFYNEETLREILSLCKIFHENDEFFLTSCLLGILHHERPGFLSYPSSHLSPYLRTKKYPPELFPQLYTYRDVESRLIRKLNRTFRRSPKIDKKLKKSCTQKNAECLDIPEDTVNAIISSPPYMNTLDYARDNRLRLWFLGIDDFKRFDRASPKNLGEFQCLMTNVMENLYPALKKNGYCVFVLGDVKTTNKPINTALTVLEIAEKIGNFQCEGFISDEVPHLRRIRKECNCTKTEWIVALKKLR